ncbi:MAG: hypothetical protein AVDCRST_MAG41-761, partial [uncultured Corynebacteriales bacterium]
DRGRPRRPGGPGGPAAAPAGPDRGRGVVPPAPGQPAAGRGAAGRGRHRARRRDVHLPALGGRPGHVPVPGLVAALRGGAVAVLVLLRPRAGRLDAARGLGGADRRLRPVRHRDRLRQRVHAAGQAGERRPALPPGPPARAEPARRLGGGAALRPVPAGAGLQPVDLPGQPGHPVVAAGLRAGRLAAPEHRRGQRRGGGVRDGRADQGDRPAAAAGLRVGAGAQPGPPQPGPGDRGGRLRRPAGHVALPAVRALQGRAVRHPGPQLPARDRPLAVARTAVHRHGAGPGQRHRGDLHAVAGAGPDPAAGRPGRDPVRPGRTPAAADRGRARRRLAGARARRLPAVHARAHAAAVERAAGRGRRGVAGRQPGGRRPDRAAGPLVDRPGRPGRYRGGRPGRRGRAGRDARHLGAGAAPDDDGERGAAAALGHPVGRRQRAAGRRAGRARRDLDRPGPPVRLRPGADHRLQAGHRPGGPGDPGPDRLRGPAGLVLPDPGRRVEIPDRGGGPQARGDRGPVRLRRRRGHRLPGQLAVAARCV